MRALALLLLALGLAGCDQNMRRQARYDGYEPSELFANGTAAQHPPPGTVARDEIDRAPGADRPPLTMALLERGHERFEIYCSPCHGFSGHGDGIVPRRGFPQPPDFHQPRLRAAAPELFVETIAHGYGAMASYADRVAPADRWAIAGYIQALQLSEAAQAAELPKQDRAKLEGAR